MFGLTILFLLVFCTISAHADLVWLILRDKITPDGQVVPWDFSRPIHDAAEQDLPVRKDYINKIEKVGIRVRISSRWINAVSVDATNSQQIELSKLKFIKAIIPVRRLPRRDRQSGSPLPAERPVIDNSYYGNAYEQLAQVNVVPLHQMGFRGSGIRIAILDNGFHYTEHPAFLNGLNVVAEKDFVNNDAIVSDEVDQPRTGDERRSSQNIHGAQVLSILAGNEIGQFLGVAPDAEYLLAKTEDNASEFPVEEDRWIAGLEWADSLGADVVNSSLGYNLWDDGSGYNYQDLDGRTALTSVAAGHGVERGLVIVVAAGNEALSSWHYITAPADADGVVSVGSIALMGGFEGQFNIAATSSRGPTADGRIKPDVVAPGQGVVVADIRSGGYVRNSGTSFAAPIVSGISALILQINPGLKPHQILSELRSSALDLGDSGADTVYGWGLVNALRASGLQPVIPQTTRLFTPTPNPIIGEIEQVFFPMEVTEPTDVILHVFDIGGSLIFRQDHYLFPGVYRADNGAPAWRLDKSLANGVYFYRLVAKRVTFNGTLAIARKR
tara:strand:+ start:2333 stop:4000 length:1668 start_codon:yes stop_codon:yes gene_type:complete